MNRVTPLALLASLAAGTLWLLQADLHATGVYPAHATQRTDPAGASILFESLQNIDTRVHRSFVNLRRFSPSPGAAVIFLGVGPDSLAGGGQLRFEYISKLASKGSRIVIAVAAQSTALSGATVKKVESEWGLRLETKRSTDTRRMALQASAVDSTWQTLIPGECFERPAGNGAVVFATSSLPFLNESLMKDSSGEALAMMLGSGFEFVFEESHLGLEESGTIIGLLRTFGLQLLLLALLVVASLWIWHNASPFPPSRSGAAALAVPGFGSQSGLLALLRSHIAPSAVAGLCWQEWSKTAPATVTKLQRDRIARELRGTDPVRAIQNIQNILQTKGSD